MRKPVEIEKIEELRLQAGIDDVELRRAIGRLQVGDYVRLTFLTATHPPHGETLPVRITRIRGSQLRGKLAGRPASAALSHLSAGSPLAFSAGHIHSILERPAAHAP
jgi:hypothetical protein